MNIQVRTDQYYKICIFIAGFFYFFWKAFVEFKSPGFEPWYFRTPTLILCFSFLILSFIKPNLNKYAKYVFFANAFILTGEFMYMVYLYSNTHLQMFYFMGGFLIIIPQSFSIRDIKYLKYYGFFIAAIAPLLYTGVYLKNDIYQTIDYAMFYTPAFAISWVVNFLVLKNEERNFQFALELKQKEQSLLQVTRLATLGEVAGGVAHEINNPLQILNLSLEIVKEKVPKEDQPMITTMENTIKRINGIIDGLRYFSGTADGNDKSLLSVKTLIEKAVVLHNKKLDENKIKVIIEDNNLQIEANEIQITQVFIHLIKNALDALSKHNGERQLLIKAVKEQNSINISFLDTAENLKPEVVDKMFTPFYTTKEVGKGSGLGLSISKGIVEENHGGKIFYQENPKRFTVSLPIR